MELKNHELTAEASHAGVLYEEHPLLDPEGSKVDGLHTVRITLDNPTQLNSYTTEMVKGVILSMRRASNDRGSVWHARRIRPDCRHSFSLADGG